MRKVSCTERPVSSSKSWVGQIYDKSGCSGGQSPPPATRKLTLVNGDVAALSVAINKRIFIPATLIRTHAATPDHFTHFSWHTTEEKKSPSSHFSTDVFEKEETTFVATRTTTASTSAAAPH